jgi:hypothetical protein
MFAALGLVEALMRGFDAAVMHLQVTVLCLGGRGCGRPTDRSGRPEMMEEGPPDLRELVRLPVNFSPSSFGLTADSFGWCAVVGLWRGVVLDICMGDLLSDLVLLKNSSGCLILG